MSKKSLSGLLGIIVGGFWLASNYRYFEEQGLVAIGMPLLIIAAGAIYLVLGLKDSGT